jgi:trimeric autotransporter adhesin
MPHLSKFALAIAGLSMLLASGPSRAGQPPCATSDGASNTACGSNALINLTTGNLNSAFGFDELIANTSGSDNSAFGQSALAVNSTGSLNSAFGANTTGGGDLVLAGAECRAFDGDVSLRTASNAYLL